MTRYEGELEIALSDALFSQDDTSVTSESEQIESASIWSAVGRLVEARSLERMVSSIRLPFLDGDGMKSVSASSSSETEEESSDSSSRGRVSIDVIKLPGQYHLGNAVSDLETIGSKYTFLSEESDGLGLNNMRPASGTLLFSSSSESSSIDHSWKADFVLKQDNSEDEETASNQMKRGVGPDVPSGDESTNAKTAKSTLSGHVVNISVIEGDKEESRSCYPIPPPFLQNRSIPDNNEPETVIEDGPNDFVTNVLKEAKNQDLVALRQQLNNLSLGQDKRETRISDRLVVSKPSTGQLSRLKNRLAQWKVRKRGAGQRMSVVGIPLSSLDFQAGPTGFRLSDTRSGEQSTGIHHPPQFASFVGMKGRRSTQAREPTHTRGRRSTHERAPADEVSESTRSSINNMTFSLSSEGSSTLSTFETNQELAAFGPISCVIRNNPNFRHVPSIGTDGSLGGSASLLSPRSTYAQCVSAACTPLPFSRRQQQFSDGSLLEGQDVQFDDSSLLSVPLNKLGQTYGLPSIDSMAETTEAIEVRLEEDSVGEENGGSSGEELRDAPENDAVESNGYPTEQTRTKDKRQTNLLERVVNQAEMGRGKESLRSGKPYSKKSSKGRASIRRRPLNETTAAEKSDPIAVQETLRAIKLATARSFGQGIEITHDARASVAPPPVPEERQDYGSERVNTKEPKKSLRWFRRNKASTKKATHAATTGTANSPVGLQAEVQRKSDVGRIVITEEDLGDHVREGDQDPSLKTEAVSCGAFQAREVVQPKQEKEAICFTKQPMPASYRAFTQEIANCMECGYQTRCCDLHQNPSSLQIDDGRWRDPTQLAGDAPGPPDPFRRASTC